MTFVRLRRGAGIILLIVSALMLGWGAWPVPVETLRVAIPAAELQPEATGQPGSAASTALPGQLTLTWPGDVRTGEVQRVTLNFMPASTATDPGGAGADQPPGVLAEARLELPGMLHDPPGDMSEALVPNKPVRFEWSLRADRPGDYPGTVWLHLRFQSDSGAGSALPSGSIRVVGAPRIQVRARSFLGLAGPWARALGGAGVVIGAVLGLDGIVIWLWRRSKAHA